MSQKIKKYLFLAALLLFLAAPVVSLADNGGNVGGQTDSAAVSESAMPISQYFSAKVTEIIKEQDTKLPDGTLAKQQNVRLLGLDGAYQGKEMVFQGINDYDVLAKSIYKVGDKVLVTANLDNRGNATFYITDYIRDDSLLWLTVIFVGLIVVVGKAKGLRALLSLILTLAVVIYFLAPQILAGNDPIIITVIGSFGVLLAIIYFTEGFNKKSHIAVLSIFISLLITIFLSWLFINLAKLTGVANEDTGMLISVLGSNINFKGLLLAGIIIGALGVLDDMVISQIATVEELNAADPYQSKQELFKKASRVGVAHISSMINTLFLAYTGASLPVLIMLSSGQTAFSGMSQIISSEGIATEIVRTLTGSIGLILAVPIATFLAVNLYKKSK